MVRLWLPVGRRGEESVGWDANERRLGGTPYYALRTEWYWASSNLP